jgi:hypothetical protein
MQTTTPKQGKRTYRKKRILTQDELWKIIIPLLWVDFIHYFLPEWVDEIDFSRKPEFLDKELKRLMPRGKSKNRAVDILMRVYMKNGSRKSFLLHVEVQAYYELLFPSRVFQYFYRIKDYLQEPIETLVIMIDEDPNYRPNEYFEQYGQTSVHFKYPMFKLLDNPPPYPDNNIFSLVLEVTWYALEQNMLKNDDDLEKLKFRLLKQLVTKKVEKEKIYAIFEFINIYLPFVNPEKEPIFVERIDKLINNDTIMEALTIHQFIEKKLRAEADKRVKRAEYRAYKKAFEKASVIANDAANERVAKASVMAKLEGKLEGKLEVESLLKIEQQKTIRNLHAKGFSVEDIADVVMKPMEFVLEALEN